MTQRDLAKSLGINHTAVGHWEVGGGVSFSRLADLSRVLRVDLRELVALAPGAGQLIDDPEELALITAWRRVPVEMRGTLLRTLVALSGRDGAALDRDNDEASAA